MVVFRGRKGFSASSVLIQLELLLARTILGDFNVLLDIFLKNRWFRIDLIKYLEYQGGIAI